MRFPVPFLARDVLPRRVPGSRVLPAIIAVMVYVACIALASSLSVSLGMGRWTAGMENRLTIQIVLPGLAEAEDQVARATGILRSSPAVQEVIVLDKAQTADLLEPWLGPDEDFGDLPMPRLIDVTIQDAYVQPDGQSRTVSELIDRIRTEIPGVKVDDHSAWRRDVARFEISIQAIAMLTVVMVGIAGIAAVVFATRAAMTVHHDVVELLHLIGARDAFIARQYWRRFLFLGTIGATAGFLLACATLTGVAVLLGRTPLPWLTAFGAEASDYLLLLPVPIAAILLVSATARITVRRTLQDMV